MGTDVDAFMAVYIPVIGCSFFILAPGMWIGSIVAAIIIRKKFPNLWIKLGSPTHWIHGDVIDVTWTYGKGTNVDSHFFTFLDKQIFLETEHPQFIWYCGILRLGWYVGLILFLLILFTVGPYLIFINS